MVKGVTQLYSAWFQGKVVWSDSSTSCQVSFTHFLTVWHYLSKLRAARAVSCSLMLCSVFIIRSIKLCPQTIFFPQSTVLRLVRTYCEC